LIVAWTLFCCGLSLFLSLLWLLVAWSLFVVVDCCLVAPFCRGIVVVNSVPTGVAPCSLLAALYGPTDGCRSLMLSTVLLGTWLHLSILFVLSSYISPVFFLLLLSWRQTPW
jgi:hypothetical protein